jgi:hypothetical protein
MGRKGYRSDRDHPDFEVSTITRTSQRKSTIRNEQPRLTSAAITFTLFVKSFHVPPTFITLPCPPNHPSVPTSLTTCQCVTSSAKTRMLKVFASGYGRIDAHTHSMIIVVICCETRVYTDLCCTGEVQTSGTRRLRHGAPS